MKISPELSYNHGLDTPVDEPVQTGIVVSREDTVIHFCGMLQKWHCHFSWFLGPKAFVILKPGKTARFSITTEMRHWALLRECFQRGLTKEMRPAEVQGIKMMKRSRAEYGLPSLCSEHLAFASVAQTATVRQNQPSVLWYSRHFVTIKGKVTETSSRKVTECLHFLWF